MASLLREFLILERDISAAALVALCVFYRSRAESLDKSLYRLGILGIVGHKLLTGTEQKTSVVRAYLFALQGVHHLLCELIVADDIAQKLYVVIDLDLAAVGDVVFHIAVDLVADLLVVLHILVDALDDIVAGGADGDKIRSGFTCSHQGTHRGKTGGNGIGRGGVHTAAALPFGDLAELYAESLCRRAGKPVKLLGLCFISFLI